MRKLFNIAVLLAFFWACGFMYYIGAALSMQPINIAKPSQAIVVLTGGEKRIDTGLQAFYDFRNRVSFLFISGVNPQVTEAAIRAMWRNPNPLPACCIILGHSSSNTVENAREIKAWLQSKHYTVIRLVTANYHMKRAELELQHIMPDIKILRHPVEQPDLRPFGPRHMRLMLSEYNKWLLRYIAFMLGKD